MVEIRKRDGMSDEARITKRLRPSNEMQSATTHVQQGSGPTRVHHTVHHGSTQKQHEDGRSKSLTDMPIPQMVGRKGPESL
jgi:ketopantoate reductase